MWNELSCIPEQWSLDIDAYVDVEALRIAMDKYIKERKVK